MKKEIAEKWVADLRTHTRQTKNKLYDGKGGHCCLGRLCRVLGATFSRNGTINSWYPVLKGKVLVSDSILPDEILALVGMKFSDGYMMEKGECLSQLNDSGKSFSEIADIIEKNWKHL